MTEGWVVMTEGCVVMTVGWVVTTEGMPVTTPRELVEGRYEVAGLVCGKGTVSDFSRNLLEAATTYVC